MKAINLTGQAPTKRQKLIDLLPLKTPLVVQIFPVYACNLKCNYCIFQMPQNERHFISNVVSMDLDLFKKCVDDMTAFPDKIKTLRFVGIGEPLLHPDIHKMVSYAKEKNIAEKIEIITNGIRLKLSMAEKLIKAGLDRLVVSIQGENAKQYKRSCNVMFGDVDFALLKSNIKYFYDNKKDCHVYVKSLDSVIENEDLFCEEFGDICDSIAIEKTVPIHQHVNLPERDKTQYGQDLKQCSICPQPFYHMQINPDMNIVPCQSFEYPIILGNALSDNVVDVWNNGAFKDFRRYHIKGVFDSTCSNCKMKSYRLDDNDILPIENMEDLFNV